MKKSKVTDYDNICNIIYGYAEIGYRPRIGSSLNGILIQIHTCEYSDDSFKYLVMLFKILNNYYYIIVFQDINISYFLNRVWNRL